MPVLRTFNVVPNLPEPLEPLREIAFNLFWAWEPRARDLFVRLDPDLWEAGGQNPIYSLNHVSQERLEELARDDAYRAHLERVRGILSRVLDGPSWFQATHGRLENGPVAYFSMEFGLHGSIPLYSGGLGVLAGDHLKAASDLGVPLVGVGLFYRNGYFRQYLNTDGWQQEYYPENTPDKLPLRPARTPEGAPVRVTVEIGKREIACAVWRLDVGRVPLFLLDTQLEENRPEDRKLTANLYGGDQATRLQQETILGIGGLRAIRAVGVSPSVCHMNEGHSALLGLEWIRFLAEGSGASFEAACQAVTAGTIFTTHTPVPAGNDEFPPDLVKAVLGRYVERLGLPIEKLLALGRAPSAPDEAHVSMTLLAFSLSSGRNGVSELHGRVSRRMWRHIWPDVPEGDVPIGAITNGVHAKTWLSQELHELYGRYLDPKWNEEPDDADVFARAAKIPEAELWSAHQRRRQRLVTFARRRLRRQLARRGAPAPELERAHEVLDPEAFTIGFARRFATYKRATLLFRDLDRLRRILSDEARPVQILFAGKAHPRDDAGKDLIRQIVHIGREEPFRNRFVFIEDYEMNVARHLVEGCDIWLNTPRRPLEASGTSGMKAAVNGVLNLSVLDGWWAEAYAPELGWAIGSGEEYSDPEYQDQVESQALYDVLEHEVIPLFYDRARDGLPRKWIERMRACIAQLTPRFAMHRMVKEYVNDFYVPASRRFVALTDDRMARAGSLAEWLASTRAGWGDVAVERIEADTERDVEVGETILVRAVVSLGSLAPGDVTIQLYHGPVGVEGHIAGGELVEMTPVEHTSNGSLLYQGQIPCAHSGRHAFQTRIVPNHPDLASPLDARLVKWG